MAFFVVPPGHRELGTIVTPCGEFGRSVEDCSPRDQLPVIQHLCSTSMVTAGVALVERCLCPNGKFWYNRQIVNTCLAICHGKPFGHHWTT